MATISDERLAEMCAAIELRRSTTPIKEEWEFFASIQSALTELQSLRSQAGVSEAVAWVPVNPASGQMHLPDAKTFFYDQERTEWENDGWVITPLYARPAPIEVTEEADWVMVPKQITPEMQDVMIAGEGKPTTSTWAKLLTAALQGETK